MFSIPYCGKSLWLNAFLIESVEELADNSILVVMMSGKIHSIELPADDFLQRIVIGKKESVIR